MIKRPPEIDNTKFELLDRLEEAEQELRKIRQWASGLEWLIRGGIGVSVVIVTSLYGSHLTNFGQAISSMAVAVIGLASQTLDAFRTLYKHRSGGVLNVAEGLVSGFLIAWSVHNLTIVMYSDYRDAGIAGGLTMAFCALLTIFCHQHVGTFGRISQTIRSQIRRWGTLLRIRSTRF